MTRDDDFIPQLEAYLDEYEGTNPLPDAVRHAVRAQLSTTRQIGPITGPMRDLMMSNVIRVGLVAAVAAVIAVIAFNLLPVSPVPGGDPSPTPEPSTVAVPSAASTARLAGQDPLDAGRYSANVGPSLDVTVAVPAGWSAGGDWVVIGPRGNQPPDGMAIRFYSESSTST